MLPNDELKKTMMPIANKYSIEEIMEACRYYLKQTNRRISFEYSLVKDVNDTEGVCTAADIACERDELPYKSYSG